MHGLIRERDREREREARDKCWQTVQEESLALITSMPKVGTCEQENLYATPLPPKQPLVHLNGLEIRHMDGCVSLSSALSWPCGVYSGLWMLGRSFLFLACNSCSLVQDQVQVSLLVEQRKQCICLRSRACLPHGCGS